MRIGSQEVRSCLVVMAKLLSVNTLDVLEARGSAFERGYAYGVRYKPLIRRLIDSHYDFYVRYLQTSREDALREAYSMRDLSETTRRKLLKKLGARLMEPIFNLMKSYWLPRLTRSFTRN